MKNLLSAIAFGFSLLCLQPAALRAEDLPKVKATEEKAIRALVGKKATITGRVVGAKEAKNGMTFLDFEGGKFSVVAWKDDYANFEGGSPAKLYAKQEIEITGTVLDYKGKNGKADEPGKLEIKLKSPGQVKVIGGKTPAEGTDAAKDKDKEKDQKDGKDQKDPKAGKDSTTPPAAAEGKETPAPDKEEKPATDGKPGRVDPKKFFK
jgi:hypothetical protein